MAPRPLCQKLARDLIVAVATAFTRTGRLKGIGRNAIFFMRPTLKGTMRLPGTFKALHLSDGLVHGRSRKDTAFRVIFAECLRIYVCDFVVVIIIGVAGKAVH